MVGDSDLEVVFQAGFPHSGGAGQGQQADTIA
jgi:hypothetical protein